MTVCCSNMKSNPVSAHYWEHSASCRAELCLSVRLLLSSVRTRGASEGVSVMLSIGGRWLTPPPRRLFSAPPAKRLTGSLSSHQSTSFRANTAHSEQAGCPVAFKTPKMQCVCVQPVSVVTVASPSGKVSPAGH